MPQTLARHVNELGRIRIGARVPIKSGKHAGEPRPERLKHFRLTSNSRAALTTIAQRYGGQVQAWTVPPDWKDLAPPPEQAWEVFTESETLDILFHPASVLHTTWEEWRNGYCVLRCNGQYIVKDGTKDQRVGEPCHCPSEPQERRLLAAKKPPEACEEISRIAVFLEGIPVGQWRLDTRGFYAPAEIRGLQDIMEACEVTDTLVRAQLRLEWRTDKKLEQGQPATFIYPCVVIEPRQSADELLALGEARRLRQIHPAQERKQLAEHIADLYGDPDAPDSDAAAQYMPRIEAAILANKGQVEPWYVWAERRFKKNRAAFSEADWLAVLAAVQQTAQQGASTEERPTVVDSTTGRVIQASGRPPGTAELKAFDLAASAALDAELAEHETMRDEGN